MLAHPGVRICYRPHRRVLRGKLVRKRRGLITIRWALWLSLLVVLVFALTTGIRLGAEYAEQLLAR